MKYKKILQTISKSHLKGGILSRKSLIIALAVLVLLGPSAYLLSRRPKAAEAAWMDDNWLYRKAVAITNSGSAQTDFQVQITLDTATLITAGKIQSDCDDIRITDINGKIIPHWVETAPTANTCNQATTKIWTKAPSIPTSGTTIYLYYGNPSVTNTKDGNETFIFFDDFSQSSLDSSKWSTNTINTITHSITSGKLRISDATKSGSSYWIYDHTDTGSQHQLITSTVDNVVIDWDSTLASSTDMGQIGLSFILDSDDTVKTYLCHGDSNGGSEVLKRMWHTESTTGNEVASASETVKFTLKRIGTATTQLVNDAQKATGTLTSSPDKIALAVGAYGGYTFLTVDIDNVRTRKTATTEPAASSPGTEEQSPGPVAHWKFDEGYGATTNDSTQNSNDGTLGTGSSAPEWQSEDMCISGKCLEFDGTDDYVNVADAQSLHFDNNFTVEAWLKMNKIPTTDEAFPISRAGEYSIVIHMDGDLGYLIHNTTPGWLLTSTSYNLPLNEWVHVALTYDSSHVIKMYANGQEVYSYSGSGNITDDNGTLKIGRRASLNSEEPFNGFIDEAKVYPYARSAAQIKTDYTSAGSVHGASIVFGASKDQGDFLSEGLVGYWKMDEASTNTCSGSVNDACDSSGNGNDGAWGGTVTSGSGKYGNSGLFASNSNISMGNVSALNMGTNDMTISVWAKRPDNGTSQELVNKGPLGTGDIGDSYTLYIQSTGIFKSMFAVSGSNALFTGTSVVDDNNWHHLVAVYDRNGNLSNYIDGVLDSQVSIATHDGVDLSNTNNFLIGGARAYEGSIDEARIYNRTLSPREVRDLYNWAPGPVVYYNFDEGSGTNLYDKSGNDFSSNSFTGSPDWTYGKLGKSLKFDGANDYVDIPDTSNSKLDISRTITLESWVYPHVCTGPGDGVQTTVVKSGAYYLNLQSGTCKPQFYFYGLSSPGYHTADSAVGTNTWSHIAAVWNGSNVKIYINGILDKEISSVTGAGSINNGYVYIGGGISTRKFDGNIDEVRIYNYARTAKQIVEDMNAGHPIGGSPIASQVSYYKFDEGYGSTANNSGNGGSILNASLVGSTAPTWVMSGKIGKALSFNGSSSYVTIPKSTNWVFNQNDFTISGWVYQNSSQDYAYFWGNYPHAGFNGEFYIGQHSSTPFNLVFYGRDSAGTLCTLINFGTTLPKDQWVQVIVTRSNTSTIKLYLNGVLKNTSALAACTGNFDWAGYSTFNLGNASGGPFFSGKFDEFKIYSSALTEDEIKLDYNQGKATVFGALSTDASGNASFSSDRSYCPPGDVTANCAPIAEWKFDEKNGNTTYDTSGNSHTGTLQSMEASDWKTAAECYSGSCLNFNASAERVTIANPIGQAGYMTASVWYKRDESSASSSWRTILGHATANIHPLISHSTSRNMGVWDGSWRDFGYNPPNDGEWHHYTVVYNSGSTATLYVDGVYQNQISVSLDLSANPIGTIGNWNSGSYWAGPVDQVRIYDYQRTPAQIAWDYNQGKPMVHYKMDENQGTTFYDAEDQDGAQNGTITGGGIWLGYSNQAENASKYSSAFQPAEATTNYADYGSMEAQTGWGDDSSLTTFEYTTSSPYIGSYNLHAIGDSGDYVYDYVSTDLSNQQVTLTAWVKGSGTFNLRIYNSSTGYQNGSDQTATTEWKRYSFTATYGATGGNLIGIRLKSTGANIYIDSVQVEQKSYPTPYCDGSLGNGHSWSGTAHASTSSRTAAYSSTSVSNALFLDKGSISLWLKPQNISETPNANQRMYFRTYNATGGRNDLYLMIYKSSGTSYWWAGNYVNGATQFEGNVGGSNSPIDNTWQHITAVWDSGDFFRFYINGKQTYSNATYNQPQNATTFYLGAGNTTYQFNGLLDGFHSYNYALTTEQIKNIYNAGSAVYFAQ